MLLSELTTIHEKKETILGLMAPSPCLIGSSSVFFLFFCFFLHLNGFFYFGLFFLLFIILYHSNIICLSHMLHPNLLIYSTLLLFTFTFFLYCYDMYILHICIFLNITFSICIMLLVQTWSKNEVMQDEL